MVGWGLMQKRFRHKPGKHSSNSKRRYLPRHTRRKSGCFLLTACIKLTTHQMNRANGANGTHEPTRLIVVEDHAQTAEGLKKFLTAVGYKVFVATDMTSALTLAAAVEFDVLLSDLGLPDGSGWELLKRLSAERRIRAIAFSGYNSPDDRQRS